MVYIQGHSVPQANHEVLDLLVAARNELAQVGNYNMVRKMHIVPWDIWILGDIVWSDKFSVPMSVWFSIMDVYLIIFKTEYS